MHSYISQSSACLTELFLYSLNLQYIGISILIHRIFSPLKMHTKCCVSRLGSMSSSYRMSVRESYGMSMSAARCSLVLHNFFHPWQKPPYEPVCFLVGGGAVPREQPGEAGADCLLQDWWWGGHGDLCQRGKDVAVGRSVGDACGGGTECARECESKCSETRVQKCQPSASTCHFQFI